MNGADAHMRLQVIYRGVRMSDETPAPSTLPAKFQTSTFAGTVGALLLLAEPWADILGAWIVAHTGVELPPGYGFAFKTTFGGIILKVATRWHSGSN